jgi:hypothetical protein
MKKPLPVALAVIVLSVILAAQAPVDQSKLAQQMQTGTDQQREAAARAVLDIPPTARDPSILFALIQELDRLKQDIETRASILASGQSLIPRGESEYLFTLLDALTQHDDPLVIHPLISFIANGNRPIIAIAAFGELALPEVLTLASDDSGDTMPAVMTLQRMLERPVRNPLSASSRQQIVEMAARRLIGNQKESVILAALDLAVATGDPSLIRRVQDIGASASEVRSMGVAETGTVRIQNRANAVLSARGLR